ncbi:MAG: molybdenum cofactor guanylyltransferase MobA [Xanthobacteraceae bacterium]|nr:molybdenum cofactor guanylyltransferase MobA [Xanthobacteraceae bacterium]QYK46249.1 MAG: molybdenum cofactor guanylyltransferase MobA [Xanthobacteraceae bacterium]
MNDNEKPLGVILAGGLASRMGGGDKTLKEIGGRTILSRVIERVQPQCSRLILNANGDAMRFSSASLPVISDDVPGFVGPLAGILAGMEWAAANVPGTLYIATVAGDCPFLPRDLIARLSMARREQGKPLACAQSGDWRHPVIGLWPVGLREELRRALTIEGLHKVEVWGARYGVAIAEWDDSPFDPFMNVNTPVDAVRANMIAATNPSA